MSPEQEAAVRASTTAGGDDEIHAASTLAWRNVWALVDLERKRAAAAVKALTLATTVLVDAVLSSEAWKDEHIREAIHEGMRRTYRIETLTPPPDKSAG